MNYLAHAWLAGAAPADRIGALLGDFVKGPLPCGLPADVAEGVRLHRQIDSFADHHPAFRRSRARILPERRRVAGILVDMFYDHFLACHWSRFHPLPLERFTADTYALLADCHEIQPPRFAALFPSMRDGDWLASYRSPDAIAAALERMSLRMRRTGLLTGSGTELYAHYRGFEEDFLAFLPDARSHVEALRRARA